jgi:hypothetical protein
MTGKPQTSIIIQQNHLRRKMFEFKRGNQNYLEGRVLVYTLLISPREIEISPYFFAFSTKVKEDIIDIFGIPKREVNNLWKGDGKFRTGNKVGTNKVGTKIGTVVSLTDNFESLPKGNFDLIETISAYSPDSANAYLLSALNFYWARYNDTYSELNQAGIEDIINQSKNPIIEKMKTPPELREHKSYLDMKENESVGQYVTTHFINPVIYGGVKNMDGILRKALNLKLFFEGAYFIDEINEI